MLKALKIHKFECKKGYWMLEEDEKKVGSTICHIVILYSKKWSPNLLAILQNLIWMEMLMKESQSCFSCLSHINKSISHCVPTSKIVPKKNEIGDLILLKTLI